MRIGKRRVHLAQLTCLVSVQESAFQVNLVETTNKCNMSTKMFDNTANCLVENIHRISSHIIHKNYLTDQICLSEHKQLHLRSNFKPVITVALAQFKDRSISLLQYANTNPHRSEIPSSMKTKIHTIDYVWGTFNKVKFITSLLSKTRPQRGNVYILLLVFALHFLADFD
jgi:hypothetical protein